MIAYENKLRKDRNITSRIMRFINWWKERCREMLDASPFGGMDPNIRAEETTRAERKHRRPDPTPTPYLADI